MTPLLARRRRMPTLRLSSTARPLDCIVLVKQVPDVSNIPEDAGTGRRGTLKRAWLDSILNPLGLQALTFPERITGRHRLADHLSVDGPPQACETLVDCMSRVPAKRSC